MSDVLPDVLLLLIDSVVDSDVLELVGEVDDEVSVIVEDRDVLLTVLLLVDSVVVSDVLVPVLEEEVSIAIPAVEAVLMVVVVDSGVVVDVDWVGVREKVELVVLMDEVEVEVSVIVGDVLLDDVLVDSVVVSDVLELADEARDGHFCNCFLYVFSQVKIL